MNNMFIKHLVCALLTGSLIFTSAIGSLALENGIDDTAGVDAVTAADLAQLFSSADEDVAAPKTSNLTDISGHWSEEYVYYCISKGIFSGYDDNTFRPDRTVTRAEFSKMLNNALGIDSKKDINFFDVEKDDWFYDDVRKAYSAGYIAGYEDNSFRPDNHITRQEAAVVLSRVTPAASELADIKSVNDYADIADWAYDACTKIFSKSYMNGDDQGRFLPNGLLTRGQAAKIISELTKNETIISENTEITSAQSFKDCIYVNDCIVSDDITSGKVNFNNCLFLGKFSVESYNATDVVINNCKIKTMSLKSDGETIPLTVTGNTEIDNVDVSCPANITEDNVSGSGFKNITLSGSKLSGGIVILNGNFENIDVYNDIILGGKDFNADNININAKSALFIQSGNIKNLNVTKQADASAIVLSNGVVVEKAQIDSVVDFSGSGKLKEANQSVPGTTYETQPDKLTGKINTAGDVNYGFIPETSPDSTDDNVSVSSNIVLNYNFDVLSKGGDKLTADYIKNEVFELRKGSLTGTKVSFNASVSTAGRTITINPVNDLENDTTYYCIVNGETLENLDGEVNPKFTFNFGTEGVKYMSFTVTPSDSSTEVPTDASIVVTFPSTVYQNASKKAVTDSYIAEQVIFLRKGSTSGELVDCNVSISSNRIFTLTPVDELEKGTKYYVIVSGGSLYNTNGQTVAKTTSVFTTSSALVPNVIPAHSATNVGLNPEIIIEFDKVINKRTGAKLDDAYVESSVVSLYHTRTTSDSYLVGFTAEVSSDRKSIKIIPVETLKASTTYYIVINSRTLKTEDGEYNQAYTSNFKTGSVMTPTILPYNGATGVEVGTDIVLTFADRIYQNVSGSTLVDIDEEYISENIELRRSSVTGKIINCDIDYEISSNNSVITLTPKTTLDADTKYVVVVTASKFKNSSRTANAKVTSYFTTAKTLSIGVIPENGEEGVPVDTDIEIEFEEKMKNASGNSLTAAYVEDNFELLMENESGRTSPVNFKATVNNTDYIVTLKPVDDLMGNTKYIVVIPEDTLEDEDGYLNAEFKSNFITGDETNYEITIAPEDDATGVSLSAPIVINFGTRISKKGGGLPLDSDLKSYFSISGGGRTVAFTADLSDDRMTVTLQPTKILSKNTTYTVKLLANKLQFSDGNVIDTLHTYTFKTGDGKPAIEVVENILDAIATVMSDVKGTLEVTLSDGINEDVVTEEEVEVGESVEVSYTGLKPETEYTVTAKVTDDNGGTYESEYIFTTKSLIDRPTASEITANSADIKFKGYDESANFVVEYYKEGHQDDALKTTVSEIANGNNSVTIDHLEAGVVYVANVICTDSEDVVLSEKTVKFSTMADVNLEKIVITPNVGEAIEINDFENMEVSTAYCESFKVSSLAVSPELVLISVNGVNVDSGVDSGSIGAHEGINTITIVVKDKNNANTNSKQFVVELTVAAQISE